MSVVDYSFAAVPVASELPLLFLVVVVDSQLIDAVMQSASSWLSELYW
jgi:hypothetical protein